MMKQLLFGLALVSMTLFTLDVNAQCESWVGSPNEEEASSAHTVYRDFIKVGDFDTAFENWEKAFKLAPAADGKRDFHYSDGVDIYMHKLKNETDAAKKEEYKKIIMDLYNGWVACMDAGSIQLPNINIDEYISYIRGREGFNMYYFLNVPYTKNLETLAESVAKGGNATEYVVFDPYARIVVYQFQNDKMSKEEARDIHQKLNAIADHNVENNADLGSYYETAKESMNGIFAQIENDIFDCAYFKEKLLPQYEANPDDGEVLKYVYNRLLQQGCDKTDPVLVQLEGRYKIYADSVNTVLQAEQYAKNPGLHARDLYKKGEYNEAIAKWQEAIGNAEEASQKAEYNYWIATTNFRKLKATSTALSYARKAVSTSSDVKGAAYILIGDIYAKMSRGCGDSWQQRLAILAALDKYSYAKSVDSSVSEEANRKIGIYNASRPERQEGFMRKIKEGDSIKVKCLGEKVRVRFVD